MFLRIATRLASLGFRCVLFDQYGTGYSDGRYQDVRLNDTKFDLDMITSWAIEKFGGEIGYICQSLGSALGLSKKDDQSIAFKIAINPAANFDSWLIERYNWNLASHEDIFCALPKGIYVSRKFILDLLNWNWIQELKNTIVPTLIIAGTKDEINSVNSAFTAKNKLGDLAKIKLIEEANHSFIGQRYLEEKTINIIENWLLGIID